MVGSVIDTGGASLPVLLATGALSGAAGVATKNAVLGRGTSVGELAEGAAWGMATAPAAAVKGPVVLGSLTPRPVPQVIANQAAGNALRDRVADGLRKMGRTVEVEVEKKTPLGVRRLDLEVSQDGKVLGGIETKLNNSPYTPSQRAKDWYLEHVRRYWVDLIRVKEN
jgi:hypothetical protein